MTGAGAGPGTGPLAAGPTGGAMTGNGRELGGSFALGPWHARRAGYGAIHLADDGVFGPRAGELGTVLCLCPLIGRDREDWRSEQ
jgi:hypothetical protein